jgi:hypothetical protein
MKRKMKDKDFAKKYLDRGGDAPTLPANKREKYKNYLDYTDESYDDYEDIVEHGSNKSELRYFITKLHHPKK